MVDGIVGSTSRVYAHLVFQLTRMPSHRETARNGLSARSVRIERKAGISAAPARVAAKLTSES